MSKHGKKLLSALLVIAMMASLLVIPAAAAEGDLAGEVGDKWVFKADDVDTEVTEGWTAETYQFDQMTGPMNFKGLQLLAARSGYYNGYLYPEKGVDIPVAGKCQVEVTCANANGTLSVGSDDENAVKLEANGTAVYSYASEEAGTVTLKQSSFTCVTKIKITAYSERPTMKLDKDSVVPIYNFFI